MFDTISINNLRGIRSVKIDGLRRINLFFGKNNCGKSTILEGIFLLTGQSNPLLPVSINSMRNHLNHSSSDLKMLFFNLDPDNQIHIAATGAQSRELTISYYESMDASVDLSTLGTGSSKASNITYGLRLTFQEKGTGSQHTSELILNEEEKGIGKTKVDNGYNEILNSSYLTATFNDSDLSEHLAAIITDKQENILVEALREIDPNIRDIQLAGTELLVDIGAAQRLPFKMMGDGLRKLLGIVVSIYRCRDGVLMIDEIDNGFHFSAMKVLWKTIIKASRMNNVQLFLSTHNIDSIKGLEEVLKDYDNTAYQDEVVAYKLIRKHDGVVIPLRYDYPSFSYSIAQKQEMR